MTKYPHERRLRNGLVDSGAQTRFAIPLITVLVLSFWVMAVMIWRFSRLAEAAKDTPLLEVNRNMLLNEIGQMLMTTSSLGILVISLAAVYLWAIYSHRIFGPTVPILRMIQNLEDGNFSHRIHLRKHDEMKLIADALNDLAATLEAQGQD
jgi:methyl-accepting chemotaxis protein